MIEILNVGHCGIERTKINIRRTIYLPNLDKDTENLVANCTECIIH